MFYIKTLFLKKKLYLYILTSTFILASCGGGGGGGSSAPTVTLSADPTSVLLTNTSTLTWSSTNATSCSATWTSQTGASGSEAVTISTAGNNSFSISCTGDGGINSASVTVEGYRETDGVVVDGYISGAEVCIDEDDSWTCDASENSTTSDNDGKFTIRYANGNLVSIGGTDLDSQTLLDNLLITHKLTGHSDFKAVTPVTSVAAFMADASLVNSALGIDSSIDVSTFDPVANKGDGGINDYLYEKGNQLTVLAFALQNIINNLNTSTETTQDYFKAITEEVEKEFTETETKVDIETDSFITKAFDNVIAAKSATITDEAKANTAKALAGVLPVIEVKSSGDLTTSVIRFAVSTLQTDIQAIANGTATAEIVTNYTSDVLAYIAEDQNIDVDEITPDITAVEDFASTSEDIAVEINVLLNDSYLTSAPISVTAGNGTSGATSVTNNLVTYNPDADFNGTDTFSYTITQGDKTSTADVTVIIEAVNDAPSINIASTIQVQENQTAVTTVSVSDVDEDELTLTLGGSDTSSFNLTDENVLTFIEAPDYETKTSYSITLTLTDVNETVTKDVIIAITNVNDVAPVFTSEATFTSEENQTAIGTVTATDAEGDGIAYSISGSEIVVNSSSGVLTFVSAPDYETKTTYTATVTASDGVNSTTQDITINVNDLPELNTSSVYPLTRNEYDFTYFNKASFNFFVEEIASFSSKLWGLKILNNSHILASEQKGFFHLLDIETQQVKSININDYLDLYTQSQGGIFNFSFKKISDNFFDIYFLSSVFDELDRSKKRLTLYRLNLDLTTLSFSAPEKIYEAFANSDSGHFGGAIEVYDNTIFISSGDRHCRTCPQNVNTNIGKILRFNIDENNNVIPHKENIVNSELQEIFSIGHRNPQGIEYIEFFNKILSSEHGPLGGDEINYLIAGENYGWPLTSTGTEYSGTPIQDHIDGMQDGVTYYIPSIAPRDLIYVHENELFPELDNSILLSSLNRELIIIIYLNSTRPYQEIIELNGFGRVSSIDIDENGEIYFATHSTPGKIYKLSR